MNKMQYSVAAPAQNAMATNKVIKNTFALLSMTLIFSAITAGLSMTFNWPHPGMILTLVGFFAVAATEDSTEVRFFAWIELLDLGP